MAINLGKQLFKWHSPNQLEVETKKFEREFSLVNTRYAGEIKKLNNSRIVRAHHLHDLSTDLGNQIKAVLKKYPRVKDTNNTRNLQYSLAEKAGVLMGAFSYLKKKGWGEIPTGMSLKNLSTIQHNEDRPSALSNNWLIGVELAKNIYSDEEQLLLLQSSARNLKESLPQKYTLCHISDDTGRKKVLRKKTIWQNNLQGATPKRAIKAPNTKHFTLLHYYQSGKVKTGNYTISRNLPK